MATTKQTEPKELSKKEKAAAREKFLQERVDYVWVLEHPTKEEIEKGVSVCVNGDKWWYIRPFKRVRIPRYLISHLEDVSARRAEAYKRQQALLSDNTDHSYAAFELAMRKG